MALTLKQKYEIGRASKLIERIVPALFRVSSSVAVEPANQPYPLTAPLGANMNASRSTKRQVLAIAVRQQVESFTARFARELADNGPVNTAIETLGASAWNADGTLSDAGAAAVLDGRIISECANSWDQQAGVLPSELP